MAHESGTFVEPWIIKDYFLYPPAYSIIAMQSKVDPCTSGEVVVVAHKRKKIDHHRTFVDVNDVMEWQDLWAWWEFVSGEIVQPCDELKD